MPLHLVTGGTGYLGRHLLAKLLDGNRKVRVLVRPGSSREGLEGVELVDGGFRLDKRQTICGSGAIMI